MREWKTIDTAPKIEKAYYLMTDGVRVGVGCYWRRVEADWKYLGYDEGVRNAFGPSIGPRFLERVPNPDFGTVREGWHAVTAYTYGGIAEGGCDAPSFTPTHWMPLPEPPHV